MEKSKKVKIAWLVGKCVLAVALFAAMFAISISAGVCSIVFGCLGFVLGWFERQHRVAEKFIMEVGAAASLLEDGDVLVFKTDDSDSEVKVSVKKPKKKKEKAAEED